MKRIQFFAISIILTHLSFSAFGQSLPGMEIYPLPVNTFSGEKTLSMEPFPPSKLIHESKTQVDGQTTSSIVYGKTYRNLTGDGAELIIQYDDATGSGFIDASMLPVKIIVEQADIDDYRTIRVADQRMSPEEVAPLAEGIKALQPVAKSFSIGDQYLEDTSSFLSFGTPLTANNVSRVDGVTDFKGREVLSVRFSNSISLTIGGQKAQIQTVGFFYIDIMTGTISNTVQENEIYVAGRQKLRTVSSQLVVFE